MLYYIINYDLIYSSILTNIKEFCFKFDLDFSVLNCKSKKEIIIYYSILEILKKLNKNKTEKPIVIFKNIEDLDIFEKALKETSKILSIPIFKINEDFSIGLNKELSLKADCFYENNQFTNKGFTKIISRYSFKEELNEKIKKTRLLVVSH